jgi:hypothetical protein
VAYVGTDGSVEKDKNWRGLAIGLDDVPYLGKDDCAWASEEAKDGVCSSWAKNLGDLSTIIDGISIDTCPKTKLNFVRPFIAF